MGGEDHRAQPPSRQEIPRAGGLRGRRRPAGENHSWTHRGGGLGWPRCRQGQPRRTFAREGSATSAARHQEQLAGDYFGRRQEPADSASARNAGGRSVAPGTSVDRAARTRRSEEGRGAAVDAGGKAGHRSGAASGCVGTAALGCPGERSSPRFSLVHRRTQDLEGVRPAGQPRAAVPTWAALGAKNSLGKEVFGFQVVLRLAKHLALVAVGKLPARIAERYPKRSLDFDPHVGGEVVDFSGHITHQVEAYDFKNALAVAPRAHVDILVVRELDDRFGNNARLFQDLSHRGSLRFFARIHQAFGKREHGPAAPEPRRCWFSRRLGSFFLRLALLRFDQGYVPDSRNLPQHDPAC